MALDLHALEIEFAKNPTLETCLPLCEGYLGAKRYMEAMVVCKKGIKHAGPQEPRGRLMMARVFLEQGKPPKSEAELSQLLVDFPNYPPALELMGRVLVDLGRRDEAINMLQRALAADTSLPHAAKWLADLNVAPAPGGPASAPISASAPPPAAAAASPVATPGSPAPTPISAASAPSPAQAPGQKSMTHVDDFFAPTSLGFANDTNNVETAGPGRLTILGFVPKNSGSLKTTLAAFVCLALAVGAFSAYQYVHSRTQDKIATLFGQMRTALDQDLYEGYQNVVKWGDAILKMDAKHGLGLSALAYTHAVLATEHQQTDSLARAQTLLLQIDAQNIEPNEYNVATRAILAFADQKIDEGFQQIQGILKKGGSSPLIEMEAFRLASARAPLSKETQIQLRRVAQSVVNQARVLNFLGFYALIASDNAKAAKYFDQTLQNVKDHPVAKLGRDLVTLAQQADLTRIDSPMNQDIAAVLGLSEDKLSPSVQALAYFSRSQLAMAKKDTAHGEADLALARKTDPSNAFFAYRAGVTKLHQADAQGAAALLTEATRLAPFQFQMREMLLSAQTEAKQWSAADATLAGLKKWVQDDPEILLQEGALLAAQNRLGDATKVYQSIPQTSEAYLQGQIGVSAVLLKSNAAQAVAQLEKIMTQLPQSTTSQMQARLLCQLGQAYEATANHAKALQSYAFGIEKDQHFADCHFFQCRLLGHQDAVAQASCKTYLLLAPYGRYAREARTWMQKHE